MKFEYNDWENKIIIQFQNEGEYRLKNYVSSQLEAIENLIKVFKENNFRSFNFKYSCNLKKHCASGIFEASSLSSN